MKKYIAFFFLGVASVFLIAVVSIMAWLPSSEKIKGCLTTRMYKVELCPGSKNYVPLNKVSKHLKKSVVLTEDSSFYDHHGFDWGAIEKNAREGWKTGKFRRGGSTITQQLAKNMFLTKDRTFIRKALEAIITYRIENTLSKDEILERYLNVVEFGKDIFGVKAAAKYYFQKSAAELTVVESAFLTLVLPNPVKYSSSFYQKELTPFARKRLNTIVNNMYRYHRISAAEYEQAVYEASYFFRPEPSFDDFLRLEEVSRENDINPPSFEDEEEDLRL